MENTHYNILTTVIMPMVTAVTGWIAGRRKQKNDFLSDLQQSINLLTAENRRLLEDITSVNREVVALRRENEELKLSVDCLCRENSQLKDEIRKLQQNFSDGRQTRQRSTADAR